MNDREPRIGRRSVDHRPVCHYSATTSSPQCEDAATVHLLMASLDDVGITLGSCDAHLPIARASGTVHGTHPYDPGLCGMPGTIWRWQDVFSWCELEIVVDRVLGAEQDGGATSS